MNGFGAALGCVGVLIVPTLFTWMVARWILGPIAEAAKRGRGKVQYRIIDFFCLVVEMQVVTAVVMGVTDPDTYVVHVNGDPLDCRRANLKIKTVAQHCQGNRKIRMRKGRPCTSQYKGVCWEERTGFWVAQINVEGLHRRIGRFRDEIAAAEAYDEAAWAAWGEYARLNFPKGIDAALEAEDHADDQKRAA